MINTDFILSLGDEDFFKFWMDLYQNKPELFEQIKDAVMKELISRAPTKNQEGLHRLHASINLNLRRETNPVARMHSSFSMMLGESTSFGAVPLMARIKELNDVLAVHSINPDNLSSEK